MSIYSDIKTQLGKRKAPQAQVGEGSAAADVMRAKATGKLGSGGGPRASTVAEGVAVEGARTTQQQQEQGGMTLAAQIGDRAKALAAQRRTGEAQLGAQKRTAEGALATQAAAGAAGRAAAATRQNEQMAAQEAAQIREISSKWNDHLANLASNRKVTTDEIFSTYKKGRDELTSRKDAWKLHLDAQAQALSAEKYVARLTRTGNLNRLHDKGQFKMEIQRLTMGEDLTNFMNQMQWQASYNQSARDFAEEINDMSLSSAMEVVNIATSSAVTSGILKGTADVASEFEAPERSTSNPERNYSWEEQRSGYVDDGPDYLGDDF